jgi:carbamoyl-phosphate synthase large subunit
VTINVLITGAAGNQAHFIWKALVQSELNLRIIGCNHDHDGVGLYQFDVGYVVPAAKDPAYVSKIIEICKREGVHIIMVGNMAEMRVLAQHKDFIKEESGAFVVTSPFEVLQAMEDKWKLTKYLQRRGFDFPRSVLPNDQTELERFLDNVQFPYVVKDRFGAGSQGIAIVRNKKQLDYFVETIPNPVIQEYLYPDDEEYTVGVFLCSSGKPAASIVVRRQLMHGMTWKAQVLPQSEIGDYCERVLEHSGCIGPCNVQLRLTDRGPIVFEVNPRFSTTTSARPHYGYNDAEMSIRHFVLHEEIRRPVIRGGRFFRVIEDVFVEEKDFEYVRSTGRIVNRERR